ncbi:alpha/beta hydrolase fold domain-containing protein [Bradyrhizobium sp. CSA207]|uniref:alpha/beta hydrolase fold domain-containing protein n=1 Tax=Bradyrhizobium sp. CSA207 TaxID=2698826 RepID=UPI0023AFF0E0|nr:alpha/beta hydrolase fold domain-containing protein [Bradyrhizobium sp. CSA207]MDE5444334.1 alpha/beta hydrolase fold domain-containing protein [Bradyrhizobium sp. CSA207]
MQVVIVGAGIGGLSTALQCLRLGMRVTLLEQAPALREIGAGVQISSNGTAVLRQLGILPQAHAVGVRPISFRVLSFDSDSVISDMPLGPAAAERYGEPFYQFHRADLLEVLLTALPPGVLRLNARVDDFEQDAHGVRVTLADGEQIHGDVLIGADGLHSVIRKKLVGDGPTVFSGKLVWRALIRAERVQKLAFKERFYGWAGADRMVWAYWVRPGKLLNFGGVVPATEFHRESWDASADLNNLRASMRGANERLAGLVDAIDEAFVTGLYDRDPLRRWTVGRATLLGDSAHAMLPYLAQGACQALEDSSMLAATLAKHGTKRIADAMVDYEARRRPRATKVQTTARSSHIFWTEKDGIQSRARDGRMKGLAQIDPLATTIWRWLYSYDVVKASSEERIAPDKRGLRSVYDTDTPAQARAWEMWHDLFTVEEEASGVRGLRKGYDRFFSQFRPKASTTMQTVIVGAADGLWIDPQNTARQNVVLHLHGGGFAFGSAECSTEYGERLAEAVDGHCFALNYRLAPEHPFPAALDDTVEAYKWLLGQGFESSSIIISGESAGGGLAVAAAMRIRDAGLPLPGGLLALSPLADNSLSSESIDQREGQDPIIDRDILTYMATGYFQSAPATDPLVSPIFGDLHGLPPMLIQAGETEVLVDDARRLSDRARGAGVDVTLHLYAERLHIFSLYPFLESAQQALAEFSAFAKRVVGSAATAVPRAPQIATQRQLGS